MQTTIEKIRTAILFSGGKDSCLALAYALKHSEVSCLINILSENSESYMFHTPNVHLAEKQAEAIGIPLIVKKTPGIAEEELIELKEAISEAIQKYDIEGVVSGAIESAYQASRIQRICDDLDIHCFNPLWQKDQIEILEELIHNNFEVIIIGTYGEGTGHMLAKNIDKHFLEKAVMLQENHINPAGEGGEMESFVLDAPFYKKRLKIKSSHIFEDKEGGRTLIIDELTSENKGKTQIENIHIAINTISDNLDGKITIINLNENAFHDYEFIKPITDIIIRTGMGCRVINVQDVNAESLKDAKKIILAGTSLKNMEYIRHSEDKEFISLIKDSKIPILGICAGMQLIAMSYGATLDYGREIGLRDAIFEKFLGISGITTIYALHKNIIIPDVEFMNNFNICGHTTIDGEDVIHAIRHKTKPIYATLFHPEARNKKVIETFLYGEF